MTCLEHLVENGICLLEEHKVHHDEWCERMKKDVNWKGVDCLSVEDLWTICQYVVYTAMAYPDDRPKGEWKYDGMNTWKCSNCGATYAASIYEHCNVNNVVFNYCPNCGAKMYES